MKVTIMKIVVIGGSGLIGSKLVTKLREQGHEAIAAPPKWVVTPLPGGGVAEARRGARCIVIQPTPPPGNAARVLPFLKTQPPPPAPWRPGRPLAGESV